MSRSGAAPPVGQGPDCRISNRRGSVTGMTGVIQPTSGAIECSLLSTRENNFGRGSLSLGQEGRPILLFKHEGAARAYGKRIEDTFVSRARKRAGLATFSIDETN